jgi:hypothetical protein
MAAPRLLSPRRARACSGPPPGNIAVEISNQFARLISNAIIYYNSAILSLLLTRYEAAGHAKALALITQLSPAAWRHILLNGHYTFNTDGKVIDLDVIVAALDLW